MNQILFIQNKKRTGGSSDIKKVALFFAIMIIVFGLILSGEGVYAVYQDRVANRDKQEEANATTVIQLSEKDAANVLITVNSKTVISELIYNWGSQASETISGQGQTTMEATVAMPVGQNTLTVKTIDVEGNQVTKQGTFTLTVDKPEINLSLVDGNIKIKVDSKTDLSNVTYKWNSQQEQQISMDTYANKQTFEKAIEIPTGQNTLTVTAVDVYGNQSEKSQEIKGVTKPKISPLIQGSRIYFEVTAEEALEKVEFEFNGKAYVINADILPGDKKKASYSVEMKKGTNTLKIKATTVSGGVAEGGPWTQQY